tara:strand:+ start:546 stop:1235 length:690 start_codon:yes stop_codon:yes gene_type:complete
MATFEAQVEALTGIGGSAALDGNTTPTDVELDQFLKDGVIDVTNRCIEKNPNEATYFMAESSDQTSNGLNLSGAKIISVVRESNVSNQWEECRYVSPGSQYKVTDSESLDFASIYNPAYTVLENGKISVFPVPGADPNQFKVYYVNNIPYNKSGSALVHTHEDIGIFPDDKVYLVVIYAAIKCLEAKMADYTITEEDPELVQTITSNLATLKQQYAEAFGSKQASGRPS